MQNLPLQVGHVDHIVVNHPDSADTRGCEVEDHR